MKLSRRQFTFGAGASLLASPFISLLRGSARADQASAGARRLIVVYTPNGTVLQHWRPTGGETSFSFPSGSILEPLAAHKSKLVVCDGLDFRGADNHEGGMAAMLTGGGGAGTESGGASVDQFVAGRIGGDTRFPSLELGVQTSAWGGSVQTRMCYRGPGEFVPPDDSPASVYQRLFGDLVIDPNEIDQRLRRRLSVLDLVNEELESLRGQVGTPEQIKLDAHLDSIRDVERALGGGVAPGTCGAPSSVPELAVYNNENFPMIGRLQTDLLVSAMACGMTRVGSLQWAHAVAPHVFSWLGLSEGHHALSHMDDGNAAGIAGWIAAERWFSEQFAYLLERLEATQEPDGSGSLLDTSLVVWCKEMGDSRLHTCVSVPFVLAGGACGQLSTGRYLTFNGDSHTKLLVSICHAMGLDNGTFGDPSYGTGPLAGLL